MKRVKRVFPVIHAQDVDQVLRNTEIACDTGCNGVFVINHGFPAREMIPMAERAKEIIHWVGVNMLGVSALEAMLMVPGEIDGLWADNAGIDETQEEQAHAAAVIIAQVERRWRGEYFGGVAFKYQREVTDLRAAALAANNHMDVITTSGRGTGKAASITKIRAMYDALQGLEPRARLGVASGITPENVREYLPYADDFLVATGISTDFHNLDLAKTRELVNRVRQG